MTDTILLPLARRFFYVLGIGYTLIWAVVGWFALDGGLITHNTACAPVVWPPVAYWSCQEGPLSIFVVTFLNISLSVTVWSPVIFAMAFSDIRYVLIAIMVFGFNIVGFSAMVTMMWRMTWAGYEILRREFVEEFG